MMNEAISESMRVKTAIVMIISIIGPLEAKFSFDTLEMKVKF
jgi:hypothetical protein